MGDPKYPRKVWRKPKRPLNYELKMDELKTLGTFGLRTKRELWKAHTELSRVRQQARSLLSLRQEVRAEKEPILMNSLARIGLVSSDATLDDVLNLNATDLLSRRLQTIVSKKLGFKTPYQARQAVIHGHIMIGDRKVDIPSYTVTVEEEGSVHFAPESKIPEMLEKTKKVRLLQLRLLQLRLLQLRLLQLRLLQLRLLQLRLLQLRLQKPKVLQPNNQKNRLISK
jgi:small subunit ribosomal protein S4